MDQAAFERGITLFNERAFYEAHEALEDAWRSAEGVEKSFLQALTQVAVSLHHHSTGNLVGAQSVLARATQTLAQFPATYCGVNVSELRRALAAWNHALARAQPAPPPPRLLGGNS